MATKKAAPKKQTAKQKAAAKGAKGKKAAVSQGIAVANHPKATQQIKAIKSWAGLAAFSLVAYLAWQDGLTFVDVATRALLWGIAAYVAVWALAVQVWRQIAIAEVRAAEKQWKARKQAEKDQVDKLRQVLEENGMPTEGAGAMPVP
jgi:hypothetical protein